MTRRSSNRQSAIDILEQAREGKLTSLMIHKASKKQLQALFDIFDLPRPDDNKVETMRTILSEYREQREPSGASPEGEQGTPEDAPETSFLEDDILERMRFLGTEDRETAIRSLSEDEARRDEEDAPEPSDDQTPQDQTPETSDDDDTYPIEPEDEGFVIVTPEMRIGPFDTEEQATSFRDRRLARKPSAPKKSSSPKTAQAGGEMTAKFADATVTLNRMPGDDEKLAKQAEGIVECLKLEFNSETTQGQLVSFLQQDAEGRREFMNTTQTAKRIYTFYRKDLIARGILTVK